MTSRPTLVQVAEHAGVSVASASRALNGASASLEMVERVEAAAAQLGYVADVMARSLKVGRTEQLALSVADLGNPVYVTMMRAVETVVRGAGYRLVLSSTGSDAEEEIQILRNLNRGYADGLMMSPLRITPGLIAELSASRLPLVVVGTLPAGVKVDNVRANSPRGIGLAVDHLVATGRRRIAFLNGPLDTVPGARRARGFARACRAAGLPDTQPRVVAGDFTHDAGQRAAEDLLDGPLPDALLCANDLLAVGAMRTLLHRGIRVPEEVAVVGMDDTDLARQCTPSLTSVSLGSAERGRLAATLLLERLADPDRPPRRVTVQPRLSIRESSSTGGPRA
jgi:LacI family transcriptional regulator, galactose operon repressor